MRQTPARSNGRSVASLLLRTSLRVLEMSRSGCLLETARFLEPGTSGRVRIRIGDRTYTEEVRVARCETPRGASGPYRIGVEFLRTRPARAASLRSASLMMFDFEHAAGVTTAAGATALVGGDEKTELSKEPV